MNFSPKIIIPPKLDLPKSYYRYYGSFKPKNYFGCNPCVVTWGEKKLLFYRGEINPSFQFSHVGVMEMKTGKCIKLDLASLFGKWGAEDPRAIVYKNRLIVAYTDGYESALAELNSNLTVKWSQFFDPNHLRKNTDEQLKNKNKNLVLFGFDEGQNNLFAVDWLESPRIIHRIILKPTGFKYETLKVKTRIKMTEWKWGEIHNGSNLIKIKWKGEEKLAGFFHSHLEKPRLNPWRKNVTGNVYYVGFYICNVYTFEVEDYTKIPILIGEWSTEKETIPHACIFPSGIENIEEGVRMWYGQNDSKISVKDFMFSDLVKYF